MGLRILDGPRLPRRGPRAGRAHHRRQRDDGAAASSRAQSAVGKRWDYGDTIGKDSQVIVGVVEDARYVDVKIAPPNMAYLLADASPDEVLSDIEVRTTGAPARAGADGARDAGARRAAAAGRRSRAARGSPGARRHPGPHGRAADGDLRRPRAAAGVPRSLRHDLVRHQPPRGGARPAHGARRRPRRWCCGWCCAKPCCSWWWGRRSACPWRSSPAAPCARCCSASAPPTRCHFASGAGVLLAVAAVAAYLPAYRASRIEPMVASEPLMLLTRAAHRPIEAAMIWFFERHEARLLYEIRRQADGDDYELVVTFPDGRQESREVRGSARADRAVAPPPGGPAGRRAGQPPLTSALRSRPRRTPSAA